MIHHLQILAVGLLAIGVLLLLYPNMHQGLGYEKSYTAMPTWYRRTASIILWAAAGLSAVTFFWALALSW